MIEKKFEDLKLNISLSIGLVDNQSDCVYLSDWIDKESYETMTDSEREQFVDEMVWDWANNYIDVGWSVE